MRLHDQSIGSALVQGAKWPPGGQEASPTASPISSRLGPSQWDCKGRNPLVVLDSPHGREGGELSRNA